MKKKPTIIAIVGSSGSGKTTLSLYLQDHLRIPAICSYTTRPMREGERNGREHWFVSHNHKIPEQPLAYTFFGGQHYWTELEQVEGYKICTYVIDERGLIELKQKWSNRFNIIAVHIINGFNADTDSERVKRDLERVDYEGYDITIVNDSDLSTFYKKAITELATKLNK